MTDDQARNEVLEALVSAATGDSGPGVNALPGNLLTVVDSFGFVQLVAAIEERLDIELDLDGVDLGDLVNSSSLVSFIQSHVSPTRPHRCDGVVEQIN